MDLTIRVAWYSTIGTWSTRSETPQKLTEYLHRRGSLVFFISHVWAEASFPHRDDHPQIRSRAKLNRNMQRRSGRDEATASQVTARALLKRIFVLLMYKF
jgi:hypothetical protein